MHTYRSTALLLPLLIACGGLTAKGRLVKVGSAPPPADCTEVGAIDRRSVEERDELIVHMQNATGVTDGNYLFKDDAPTKLQRYRLVGYKCPAGSVP